ncbi:unnamed protein product [Pylaiella littoralis]
MMEVEDLMNTKEWQTVTSAISTTTSTIPARAWRTPLSRHLKLASFLTGCENGSGGKRVFDETDLADEGITHPLHVAASQNILKLGSMILSGCAVAGVDPCVRDDTGRTPLHWAAMADRAPFMLLLLENGATVDAVDSQNRTPLLSSSAFGATSAVRLLLQRGADVSKASRGGLTPLHAAAAGGHVEVVERLIAAGADVDKRTDVGAKPRHCAEKEGHTDVVRALLLSSCESRLPSLAASGAEAGAGAGGGEGGGGENEFWGRGGGGGRIHSHAQERRVTFVQHRFDRQSLLRRRLSR